MRDPSDYGSSVHRLVVPERLMELGPGQPNRLMRSILETLSIERLFLDRAIVDPEMARCCLAGLWLYHDFLDESHRISQGISTAEGSYWHGIMHRREPDAWNSKYWFRRVGPHRIFPLIERQAASLGYIWRSPFDFVDDCERQRGSNSAEELLLRRVQAIEWRLLFDYCWQAAVGTLPA